MYVYKPRYEEWDIVRYEKIWRNKVGLQDYQWVLQNIESILRYSLNTLHHYYEVCLTGYWRVLLDFMHAPTILDITKIGIFSVLRESEQSHVRFLN